MNDTNTESTEPKKIGSIDQIFKMVEQKDASYASHFFVPSLDKEIPFSDINTSQQKRLVKSIIDSPIYNTEFIYTFREILKENCKDKEVNVDKLTIIDKLMLALSLRLKSIGQDVDVEIEAESGKTITVTLDVAKILDMASTSINPINPIALEDDYFKVECGLPTIEIEYKMEKELRKTPVTTEIENIEELRSTIGDAFVSEIVKYITGLYIKNEDELTPIDWQKFSFKDRIKVVESFKTGLLKNIISYISDIRKEIDKIELVNFTYNNKAYERRLSIDGRFFILS